MRRDKAIKFFKLAMFQADLFSKDPNRKVGSLLIAPDSYQILSTGYNGFARGVEETETRWQRPNKNVFVCHSEMNLIANAARGGVKVENSICVVTMFPCVECSKILIQSGIKTIVSSQPDYSDPRWGEHFKASYDLLSEVGMELILLNESDFIENSLCIP